MTKKRPPAPPVATNPIVVKPSMSEVERLAVLDELLQAHGDGNVDRAAKCVIEALSTKMERELVESLVSVVNNMAHEEDSYPPSLATMLRKATDAGFHEFAYNAANQIFEAAKSIKQYREAEAYFKIAMAFKENPALQAAAYVNYCPIVRDGLISGKPDWPAAVEIYETAARMGLVKAMFNAGTVCGWLADKGHEAYGARAAYWYNHALEHRASRKPSLDMESLQELEESEYARCMVALSALNIDARFAGADLEEGIRWAREMASRGDHHALNNLGIGRIRRLVRLVAKPQNSPGANWRTVLVQLDWRFKGEVETRAISLGKEGRRRIELRVDHVLVEMADGSTMPLFVTHDACLPCDDGFELLSIIAQTLEKQHPTGFFLLPRKALFVELKGRSCTPIYAMHKGRLRAQALWASGSPDLVLQHAQEGIEFPDERFSNWTCMVPIAVNALDEGFVVAAETKFEQPYVSVGEPWRMPFVDKDKLLDLRIVLEGGPVSRHKEQA
jgi:hypothetical protein